MSKVITTNRKAYRDYEVFDKFECGIQLAGSEVKSIRDGKINLEDSFARIEKNEVKLYNTYISPYAQASYLNVDSVRTRKLLLHKSQISRLSAKINQKGTTLVPLKAYFNDRGFVKIELGLCKGKKSYDKRSDIKKKEAMREVSRALKNRRR